MSKKESTFLNMMLALLIITAVAGLSLGYVNHLTLEPKAKAKLAKKREALKTVLPEFNNDAVGEVLKMKSGAVKDSLEIYPAFQNKTFVGAAVIGSSEKGYNGLVRIMVGFSPEGTVRDIVVLEQKETPGLGTKMKNEKFLKQFRDQDFTNFDLRVKKDGGEVDALTGATITTRAFTEAIQQAHGAYLETQNSLDKTNN